MWLGQSNSTEGSIFALHALHAAGTGLIPSMAYGPSSTATKDP